MGDQPQCPDCGSEYAYEVQGMYNCPDCGHEWTGAAMETETTDTGLVVKDSCGNLLQDGDAITVIKDLKVKGAAQPLKVGTKVKNIRLVDGDHNIDCKIPGFGAMQLKIRVCEEGVGLYCGWGRRPRLQQAAARPIASSICA